MTVSYRAAVLAAPRFATIVETSAPELGARQIRVRLQGCGVCASNLPVWEGRPWFQYPLAPGAPGHEGWGVVDAVGTEVSRFDVGEPVAFMSQHAYAECDVSDEDCAVSLPQALEGQPFPGEALACAMNIFERSDVRSGHSVAIVGAGFLGVLLTQLAKHAGAEVIVLSRRGYALEWARVAGAIETVECESTGQATQRAMDITAGRGCDRVIEAVGAQSTLDLASNIAAERGRLVIAGYHQDGPRSVNMQQWNWRGLDVVNAHERKMSRYVTGMQRAIDAVLEGRMDPFPLITHRLPLAGINEAFDLAIKRPQGFMKAVLQFDARPGTRH